MAGATTSAGRETHVNTDYAATLKDDRSVLARTGTFEDLLVPITSKQIIHDRVACMHAWIELK